MNEGEPRKRGADGRSGRTKRIAGSRLAGGNASENGGGFLNILRKHGVWEHLLMEDAPERGNLAS